MAEHTTKPEEHEMMDAQKLQAFCSTDTRLQLHKPVSRGEHTFAANGHILVRVPRLADVAENADAPDFQRVVDEAVGADDTVPLPCTLPAPETIECEDCDGGNKAIHDCPDCECLCETCGGSGSGSGTRNTSCTISGVPFDVKYIRMIAALPGARIAKQPSKTRPTFFEFDGGIGAVISMRTTYAKHIGELIAPQGE